MAKSRRNATLFLGALGIALGMSATACSTGQSLVASDGSHRMVARDAASGVTVVLTTEAWRDENPLVDELTVLHLLVSNSGTHPVLLAPGDFELRNERGFAYALLDAGSTFAAAGGGGGHSVDTGAYDHGAPRDVRSIRGANREISSSALPWGVLLPGTEMRGFVYFDKATQTSNATVLTWRATTPEHARLADFAFQLHVADD